MSKNVMTFINEVDYTETGGPKSTNMAETDAIELPQILNEFEMFLRGSGYVFEGHLDIVEDSL
jgi:hypothetical protein